MFETASNGDVFQLSGTQSYFTEDVSDDITQRIEQGDLLLTAPLFGDGELVSSGAVFELETAVAVANPDWLSLLRSQGLKQERRAITLVPKQVEWTWLNDDAIVSFEIPSGCFATSVLRECIHLIEQPDQEER
jgi:tRNA pseudouridine13 synthase